jgi:glycosyltransferase involved in cell wall biosynthesis
VSRSAFSLLDEPSFGPPEKRTRLRVLHVIQNLNYGGMERLLADIVRRLDESRFERHVLVLQYLGRFAEGLDDLCKLHVAVPMTRWSMIRPAELARQIESIAPDVVHSHSGVWFKATRAARMAGVPRIVHTEHGRSKPDPLLHRTIDSIAARRTDVVAAVSSVLGDYLIQRRIASRGQIRVVPNGVDTDIFRPRPDTGVLRRELGVAANAPIIGSIGRLERIKGYDVMIAAFAILLGVWRQPVKPLLVIAGEGSERTRLEGMIRDFDIAENVRLLGWRDDTQALHAAFALFSMSSRSEGTSVSLLEAMSAGLCPVVTDVGGNRAVVGDSMAHRLVRSEEPEALAAAWREALLDPDSMTRDGLHSRMRVKEHFALQAMVSAYEDMYDPEGGNGKKSSDQTADKAS